jgi:hypothetical protein
VFTECPITVFPFIIRQHAHICCKHIFACSCSHMEHMHASSPIAFTFLCCLDLVSTYNHNATSGKPIIKKTTIVLIGICKTNKEKPKHTVPIPRMKIHRVVIFISDFAYKAGTMFAYLITSAPVFFYLFSFS